MDFIDFVFDFGFMCQRLLSREGSEIFILEFLIKIFIEEKYFKRNKIYLRTEMFNKNRFF
jgi:hypothetical protein